jgi:hypothetical protein
MRLPTRWYYTLAEVAQDCHCHADAIAYYADAGLVTPAVLLPEARLSTFDVLGPSPHLVVMLPGYRNMVWTHGPEGSCAQLVGDFTAFEVDGETFQNLQFEAEGVLVWRHDLVLTIDQRERLDDIAADSGRGFSKQERRTLLTLLHHFAKDSQGDRLTKPYGVARDARSELLTRYGIELSEATIAAKLKDASAAFDAMKPRAPAVPRVKSLADR